MELDINSLRSITARGKVEAEKKAKKEAAEKAEKERAEAKIAEEKYQADLKTNIDRLTTKILEAAKKGENSTYYGAKWLSRNNTERDRMVKDIFEYFKDKVEKVYMGSESYIVDNYETGNSWTEHYDVIRFKW